jgi:hypothetical protein
MHQTTVRFSAELWEALEKECDRIGVSVAQFLREAAITRIAYAAGRRGDASYERALDLSGARGAEAKTRTDVDALEAVAGPVDRSANMVDRTVADFSEASALAAQGRQARQRSRELRESIHRNKRH